MKKTRKYIFCMMGVIALGLFGLFAGKAKPVVALTEVPEITETITEMPAAEQETPVGQTEMPGIIKYMIFSIVGVVLLAIIAAIYCAVKPPRKPWMRN